ncbi:MAG: pentapeptide repeat-containing protein [Acaryochloris sp. RU_4_1]|nr:pentapeptide repeat-containing protein [Acaryochloris sp. RU_4_1]
MTQSTVPNNDFSNNKQRDEKSEVKSFQEISTNSQEASEFEIPAILKNSFNEIYHGPNLFRKEYELMRQAAKLQAEGQQLPLDLDAYRRLYELRSEDPGLPAYPSPGYKWWKAPVVWGQWFGGLCGKKQRALGAKGVCWVIKQGVVLSMVGAVGHYIWTIPARQKQSHNQAWQIINSAQKGESGGRVEALQDLVKDGISLARLDAHKAYLVGQYENKKGIFNGIQLGNADLYEANLAESDLTNANLKKVDLSFAKLERADMSGAKLIEADLTDANLRETILKGADLTEARLERADLRGASLRGAALTEVHLKGALYDDNTLLPAGAKKIFEDQKAFRIAPGAELEKAYLRGFYLKDANLSCTKTNCTNLKGANLMDIDLSKTNLKGADLTDALYNKNTVLPEAAKAKFKKVAILLAPGVNLIGAHLMNADLRFVNLQEADLSEADLSEADLSGANLIGANLTDAQLKGAKYNSRTVFPDGFEPVKVGMQDMGE